MPVPAIEGGMGQDGSQKVVQCLGMKLCVGHDVSLLPSDPDCHVPRGDPPREGVDRHDLLW